ncbi:MAG TPA: proton-conducting transporter membrane subunit, partial [Actinophytocola sp.]|nr:proton-conducting transporter membrane subunit [Actinophytocola sp.]
MSVAATFLFAAVIIGVLSAVAAVLPSWVTSGAVARSAVAGAGTALTGVAGVVAGIAALTGDPYVMELPGLLPLTGFTIAIDALGGVFVTVVGAVATAAGIYGVGAARSLVAQAVVPLFVVAMLLVPVAGNVGAFLVCWELVALTSLLLVVAEHRTSPAAATAGRWYGALSQLGFLTVLSGLLLVGGPDDFAALREATPSGAVAGAAFVLTLLGFAAIAGVVPLHVALPRAHAAAPSQAAALMSAAMVTLGGYGIVRVGLDLLGGGPGWWWLVVLALGSLTAVHGNLRAAASGDLGGLLARASAAGMGLVLVGIGAAGLFASAGDRVLAGLALAAALLHVLNHAAGTTLLFLAAGSVRRGAGTRDLDGLGGLRKGMPVTTAAF